jgi:adenylate cyclase
MTWRAAFACALAVTGLVLGLRRIGLLEGPELAFEDAALEMRDRVVGRAEKDPAPWVTVVRVTESDLRRYGHPLPDALLADALARIVGGGPRVVGVDLYRDLPSGPGRAVLAAVADAHPAIVFVESLPVAAGSRVPPPDFVKRPAQRGFADVVRDDDGRVRRLLLLSSEPDGSVRRSLALTLVLGFLAREPGESALTRAGDDHDLRRPMMLHRGRLERVLSGDGPYGNFDDRGYQIRADFRHDRTAYDAFDVSAVLSDEVPDWALRDRVVLLGSTAASVSDGFREPTDAGASRAGVELHALTVDQLLRTAFRNETPSRELPGSVLWAGTFALAVAGSVQGLALHGRQRVLAAFAAALAAPAFAVAAGLAFEWRVPGALAASAFLGGTLLGGVERLRRERQERLIADRLLVTQVSSPVRDALWRERDSFLAHGRLRARRVTATVLFADMVAYAEVAETTTPEVLLEWLSEHMEALAEVVETHGGVVDDYWGDGLKANFGALLAAQGRKDVTRDARNAVRCAFAIDTRLEDLGGRWNARGMGYARMRIGIHTGPIIVGSLGGLFRHKLTSVGDTVNVASRLESFLREHPGAVDLTRGDGPRWLHVFASEETIGCLGGAFRTEALGEHTLRGRRGKVCIHRVLGPAPTLESGTIFDGSEGPV